MFLLSISKHFIDRSTGLVWLCENDNRSTSKKSRAHRIATPTESESTGDEEVVDHDELDVGQSSLHTEHADALTLVAKRPLQEENYKIDHNFVAQNSSKTINNFYNSLQKKRVQFLQDF